MNWRARQNKGFTLIELLVVISIISLLSSVILAGLQNARVKARKTAIKESFRSLLTNIENSRADNDDYDGRCNDESVENQIQNIINNFGDGSGDYGCESGASLLVYVKTVDGYECLDSSGGSYISKTLANVPSESCQ
jgi:prepilin-type N-terminal cleavage/methylation domain-containing protein